MAYLLKNIRRGPDPNEDAFADEDLRDFAKNNLGRVVIVAPSDQHIKLVYVTRPGAASNIYYSFCFKLLDWEYRLYRIDDWVEVSPVYAPYYNITMKQKEELEAKIKSGLASAAQAVADLELLKHDQRKYREFLNYFQAKDENMLRSVFIDQVDVHTGDISIRNIVTRWPTLIVDFMKLKDEDVDSEKVRKKLDISKAEAAVVVTKNKLYLEWKKLFLPEVEARLKRIEELITSREKSVAEYREWLKPYIARHKLLREGFERPELRKELSTEFLGGGGHAISRAGVTLWAWREFESAELTKPSREMLAMKPINPYDDFVKKQMIFHPKNGLITEYPWITKEWADENAKFVINNWLDKEKLYYGFLEFVFDRTNYRFADGSEVEDSTFDLNMLLFSQNALLVKLLELKAKQEELERYVNELIGIEKYPIKPLPEEKKKFQLPSLPSIEFFKRGPYERDFDDRITKMMLRQLGMMRYSPIIAFLKDRIGFGR